MKNTICLMLLSLVGWACGPSIDEAGGITPPTPITPVAVERPSEAAPVAPTVVCSGETCRERDDRIPGLGANGPQQLFASGGFRTYLGFDYIDYPESIAVDLWGNSYITGWTYSLGTPENAYVAKVDGSGHLVYFSYFPGRGRDIAVDGSGNTYLIADNLSGGSFIAKLNSTGTAFLYYVRVTWGLTRMALDPQGNAYVTGGIATSTRGTDVVMAKLNPSGTAFAYAVSFGGSLRDAAYGIGIDTYGNAYVAGTTESADFPTAYAYQSTRHTSEDMFATKLNAAGNALLVSTYLPSGVVEDVTVDAAGNLYAVGRAPPGGVVLSSGTSRCFSRGGLVMKMSSALWPVYATCTVDSDTSFTRVRGVVWNPSTASAVVIGDTTSATLPLINAWQGFGGNRDAFMLQLDSGGTITASTYLGGTGAEESGAIALGSTGSAYVAIGANSTNTSTSRGSTEPMTPVELAGVPPSVGAYPPAQPFRYRPLRRRGPCRSPHTIVPRMTGFCVRPRVTS